MSGGSGWGVLGGSPYVGGDDGTAVTAAVAGIGVGMMSGMYIMGAIIILLCIVLIWMTHKVFSAPCRPVEHMETGDLNAVFNSSETLKLHAGVPEGYTARFGQQDDFLLKDPRNGVTVNNASNDTDAEYASYAGY